MQVSKFFIITSLVFLFGSHLAEAQEATQEEKILGAIVGGVIGSQVGSGSGRDAATVAGALIGYNWAENRTHGPREFVRHCRRVVPSEYRNNDGAKKAWIEGCVNRLKKDQEELERKAYEEGLSSKQ
jgi:hypothetical protein